METTKGNKCVLCPNRGTLGYFTLRPEWCRELQINAETVHKTARVCFRHFSANQLSGASHVGEKTRVRVVPGMNWAKMRQSKVGVLTEK